MEKMIRKVPLLLGISIIFFFMQSATSCLLWRISTLIFQEQSGVYSRSFKGIVNEISLLIYFSPLAFSAWFIPISIAFSISFLILVRKLPPEILGLTLGVVFGFLEGSLLLYININGGIFLSFLLFLFFPTLLAASISGYSIGQFMKDDVEPIDWND